jgi:nitrate reductase delta subunit
MQKSLRVLSALLTYPTQDLKSAVPEIRTALAEDGLLAEKNQHRLERIIDEIENNDLIDLQERYVLLFDRTRSLSLHLFEHVHGESRDRGQAMVDLQQLYEQHDLAPTRDQLPDFIPLFLDFVSRIDGKEARGLLNEPAHIFEAIRLRLKKRKSMYSSIFSALQILAKSKPKASEVEAMLNEPDPDPNDLEALDAAWEEEEVLFGPTAAAGNGSMMAKMRSAIRPAPGMVQPEQRRTVFTQNAARQD